MDERHAFVHEIRAHPHDETPRLIYADYLEEAGDPRGEFVRIQCELSHLNHSDGARPPLESREKELLAEFGEQWLEPLRDLGVEGANVRYFERGLIERIRMDAGAMVANIEKLCEIEPALSCVDIRFRGESAVSHVASCALPEQITAIDLSANRLESDQMAQLVQASWPEQISDLNLQFNRLGDEGAQRFVSVAWPNLEHLNLSSNQLGPDAIEAIRGTSLLGQLKTLKLSVNQIGDVGVQRLAESYSIANEPGSLVYLDLASNAISSAGVTRLADAPALSSLRTLILRSNSIDAGGLKVFSESKVFEELEELDLRTNVHRVGNYGYGSDAEKLPKEIQLLRDRFGDVVQV